MIFGECPYDKCNEPLIISLAPGRIVPESYTEEGFREEFSVNEETKEITKKETA